MVMANTQASRRRQWSRRALAMTALTFGVALGGAVVALRPAESAAVANGVALNGVSLNGLHLNGVVLNGTSFNGAADAGGTDALRVKAVRLPDGRQLVGRPR